MSTHGSSHRRLILDTTWQDIYGNWHGEQLTASAGRLLVANPCECCINTDIKILFSHRGEIYAINRFLDTMQLDGNEWIPAGATIIPQSEVTEPLQIPARTKNGYGVEVIDGIEELVNITTPFYQTDDALNFARGEFIDNIAGIRPGAIKDRINNEVYYVFKFAGDIIDLTDISTQYPQANFNGHTFLNDTILIVNDVFNSFITENCETEGTITYLNAGVLETKDKVYALSPSEYYCPHFAPDECQPTDGYRYSYYGCNCQQFVDVSVLEWINQDIYTVQEQDGSISYSDGYTVDYYYSIDTYGGLNVYRNDTLIDTFNSPPDGWYYLTFDCYGSYVYLHNNSQYGSGTETLIKSYPNKQHNGWMGGITIGICDSAETIGFFARKEDACIPNSPVHLYSADRSTIIGTNLKWNDIHQDTGLLTIPDGELRQICYLTRDINTAGEPYLAFRADGQTESITHTLDGSFTLGSRCSFMQRISVMFSNIPPLDNCDPLKSFNGGYNNIAFDSCFNAFWYLYNAQNPLIDAETNERIIHDMLVIETGDYGLLKFNSETWELIE